VDADGTVEVLGSGPRVVLVHGSVTNARWLWMPQRTLADSFTLVMPNRSGYPPREARDYIDFEQQADELAELLDDGSHLVGFSHSSRQRDASTHWAHSLSSSRPHCRSHVASPRSTG
jgi:hypothetical protein